MRGSTLSDHLNDWPAQREQRLRLGDRLDRPREVDHVLYFRRGKSAKAAAQELAGRGFRVSVAFGVLRTAVSASRDDPLTDADVARVVGELVGIAEAHGGHYDGFGGTVVPADDGPSR